MNKRISVCMATYNGEKYIREQLESILQQLGENDEMVISDDSSTDNTVSIINEYTDPRIILLKDNKFYNPIFNFENAISNASGEVIVLSDQDDIWLDNKMEVIRETFEKKQVDHILTLVMDNYVVDDERNIITESLFEYLKSGTGLLKNFFRNTYLGCNMAFSRELIQYALPFPKNIPMHDIWLGLLAELHGNVIFLKNKTIFFRRHANTNTKKSYSIFQIAKWRILLFQALLVHIIKFKIKM